jgi:hypothetical protein
VWKVTPRWVVDSEKFNEWMNPADYTTPDFEAEIEAAQRAGGEVRGSPGWQRCGWLVQHTCGWYWHVVLMLGAQTLAGALDTNWSAAACPTCHVLLLLLQGKRSAAGQGGTAKKARVDGATAFSCT